jgi:hypothetical protein
MIKNKRGCVEGEIYKKMLTIDPSGTGTTGLFFTDGEVQEFHDFHSKN